MIVVLLCESSVSRASQEARGLKFDLPARVRERYRRASQEARGLKSSANIPRSVFNVAPRKRRVD